MDTPSQADSGYKHQRGDQKDQNHFSLYRKLFLATPYSHPRRPDSRPRTPGPNQPPTRPTRLDTKPQNYSRQTRSMPLCMAPTAQVDPNHGRRGRETTASKLGIQVSFFHLARVLATWLQGNSRYWALRENRTSKRRVCGSVVIGSNRLCHTLRLDSHRPTALGQVKLLSIRSQN
jgi:hypothetical protein